MLTHQARSHPDCFTMQIKNKCLSLAAGMQRTNIKSFQMGVFEIKCSEVGGWLLYSFRGLTRTIVGYSVVVTHFLDKSAQILQGLWIFFQYDGKVDSLQISHLGYKNRNIENNRKECKMLITTKVQSKACFVQLTVQNSTILNLLWYIWRTAAEVHKWWAGTSKCLELGMKNIVNDLLIIKIVESFSVNWQFD